MGKNDQQQMGMVYHGDHHIRIDDHNVAYVSSQMGDCAPNFFINIPDSLFTKGFDLSISYKREE